MKPIQFLSRGLTRLALAAALTSLTYLPVNGLAQEKGAERLLKLNRASPPPTAGAEAPKAASMSCPKCQDATVRIPDASAKGAASLVAGGRPMKSVARHLCEGCQTTLNSVGHGKAKKDIVQHTCTACGADSKSCCDTTGKQKPTQGMEADLANGTFPLAPHGKAKP